jgi:hypothetical protein
MGTATGSGGIFRVGLASNATPGSLPVIGSDTFRTLGYIESDTPPTFKKKISEVPTLADGTLQFGGGLEAQIYEINYVRNFTETANEDVFTDGRSATALYRNFKIVFSDAGSEEWNFVGFVSEYALGERTSEGAIKVKVTINVYGSISVTP